ncbi:MAG: NAD(P)-dependent oxidoreductase [Kiritimatiellia bacterium]
MRIGFIGTGIMGAPMAGHLMDAGYALNIFTRTRSKAEELLSHGAIWHESPASVASCCEIIFTIVGYPSDVEDVYLGDKGIIANMKPGGICVDMTTSSPALAVRIAEHAAEKNIAVLDAPVSGGDKGAQAGTVVVMLGGDKSAYEKVKPLIECFSSSITRFGGPGCGQHAKMCNQIAIAGAVQGVAEAVAYAEAQGLDVEQLVSCIGGGAAGSWQLKNLAAKMSSGDYAPGFMIKHFLKDMKLADEETAGTPLKLETLKQAVARYEDLQKKGFADEGTQAVYRIIKNEL